MNYSRKYKQALDTAKGILESYEQDKENYPVIISYIKEVLYQIFPELNKLKMHELRRKITK